MAAGYNVKVQNTIAFLYTSNEQLENKFFKAIYNDITKD